jgi:protocatechuate 3,4-dioxygenase beta subunit
VKHFFLIGFVYASTLAAQPVPGTGSIEGRVVNSLTGASVRKASVNLNGSQVGLSADTDAEGRFQFTALPPGSYQLSANRAGFLNRRARRPVALGQDDHVTDAEIRLPPQAVISGHVVDEDGDPLADVSVRLFKQVYRNGRKQWDQFTGRGTDDTGQYRIPNLPPGRYLVEAESAQHQYGDYRGAAMADAPSFYPNARSQQTASPVDVGTGTELSGIDIHVSKTPVFHVRGKVIGSLTDLRTGIHIVLIPAAGATGPGGLTTASAPDYTFDAAVLSGQYDILADVISGTGQELYAAGSVTVTGSVTGVVLTISPPLQVTGAIAIAESDAKVNFAHMAVALGRRLSAYGQVQTFQAWPDASGKLVFPKALPPGRYWIDVNSPPDGCFIEKMRLGGEEFTAHEFEIQSATQIEIVLGSTAGTITGAVSDGQGKPFPYSTVTLVPEDAKSQPDSYNVDNNGNFKFSGLRPGAYKLFAWEEVDEGLWQDPEFRKKYDARAAEITIGPSENKNLQLQVIAAEEIK